jgi:F-type H+-transporting ATPase subunit gamma
MANIKDLKKKIKSTKGTLKITTAMKLVSAAKLSKAQQAIQGSRPYAQELEETIKTVSALVQDYSHPYLEDKAQNNNAIILVISSDKGLCGSYNSALAKKVRIFANENTSVEMKYNFIGKKVRDLIKAQVNVGKTFTFDRIDPSMLEMRTVIEELSQMFTTGEVGKVFVAYNTFHSAISFEPTIRQVLPMTLAESERQELSDKFPFDFKYEPNPKEILDALIPETVVSSIWTGLLDAKAAEHGSRMSAMDNAARNCKDAIRTLTLKMNKLRQAAITTELIEVVSGAESLNG